MNKKNPKNITVEQALALVKNNDKIVCSDGPTEPQAFLSALHTIAHRTQNVQVWMTLSMRSYPFLQDKEIGNKFKIKCMFLSKPTRDAMDLLDNVSYVPTHLSKTAVTALATGAPDIFVGTCTPPDKNGKVSLGLADVYESDVIKHAKMVILEVNPNMPYTYGTTEIDISNVDYFVDVNFPLTIDTPAAVNDKDKSIGAYISEYINDGDCMQIGIGSIPNSVVQYLESKKDLGIHTELAGDGAVGLVKRGIANGKYKTIDKELLTTSIVFAGQSSYDFVNKNKAVKIVRCAYANAHATLAQSKNQVSINTTLEVDLTGQCCSESFGSKQFSGTGGQSDTAYGTQLAEGGRSFIALYSTANAKQPDGSRKEISKIVTQLKSGSTVSLHRNDLHHLATEYGVVNLRGLSIAERAKAIISIAHPDFRDGLIEDAKKLGLFK
ncbi:MAG: 4-hydroxybutyrate--acetyl-CoA CoA transferase [Firmicutes bacterium]|nr:4-hydroxybutyrate--acetyl-CoA CoA transferase [Bacillota bacterium]